jgi:hypothetical protein
VAQTLAAEALAGSASQRLGLAQVASANLAKAKNRAWCEERLLQLFNDEDAEVRRQAALCFRQLEGEPLEDYQDLITAFCGSAAYQDDSFSLLHVLENSTHRLPGIAFLVCSKFFSRFGKEASDIRTGRAGDSHTVAKLVFRTYHQHRQDEWASRCLDLIDRLCLEGIEDTVKRFDEYER